MADESNVLPLSTDDLRANASKWTLAGDVGLLAHLEEFSNNIFKKAENTEHALNNLLDRVEEVSANFSNVSNQFQSLHNSQFLENRVYDDETPTEEHNASVVKPVEETQQQVLTKYKEAVVNGLQLLDTHFEQVELPQSSDSEDEPSDGGSSLLLKPKVAYTTPLPLVIGSAEWWADDTVGLGEFLENDESEPELSNSESPAVEKRIRLSSSSCSNSSEDIKSEQKHSRTELSGRLGATRDEPDQLFEPIMQQNREEKESNSLFGGNSNLFEDDDDDDGLFDKPPPSKSLHSHNIASNTSKTAVKEKPDVPVKKSIDEKSYFGEDEVDDSIFNSERIPPNPVTTKVSNEFTKELFAKLGTVAKNQNESPNEKIPSHNVVNQLPPAINPSKMSSGTSQKSISQSNEVIPDPKLLSNKNDNLFGESSSKKSIGTGLFDNDSNFDDDDFLFGSKTAPVRTASARTLNVPSKLFDDDEDDLSPIGPIHKNKIEIDDSKNAKIISGSLSKKPKSTNIFSENLFPDDLEDDLFSAISSKPPVKAAFPKIAVTTNETNSPVFVEQPVLKSSTPAVGFSIPDDNLFGGISGLEKTSSSNESEALTSSENLLEHPSMDDARIESVQYDSRDLGFIETSDISDMGNSQNRGSPTNWFQPQFSSTRAAAVTNETSGYKTVTSGPSIDSAVTSNSTENSSAHRINQKISSIAENDSTTNQKLHKSDDASSSNISIKKDKQSDDLFASDQNEPDDLFKNAVSALKPNISKSSKEKSGHQPKPVKPLSLFDDDEDDDLFSSKTVNEKAVSNKSQTQELSKSTVAKSSSLFADDVEDNVLFCDVVNKPQDNVSISSGKSSIFEEPTHGKSTLPSIFSDKPYSIMKTSLFEDVDDDIDLFSNKQPLENSPKLSKNENKSDTISKIELPDDTIKDHSNNSKDLFINKKYTPPSSRKGVFENVNNDDIDLFSNKKPLEKSKTENKSDTISIELPNDNVKGHSNNSKDLLSNKKYTTPSSNREVFEKVPNDDIDLFSNKPSLDPKMENKPAVPKQGSTSKNDLFSNQKPTPPSSLNIRKKIEDLKTSYEDSNKAPVENLDDDTDLFSNKKTVLKDPLEVDKKSEISSIESTSKNNEPNPIINKKPTYDSALNKIKQSDDLNKSGEGDAENVKVAVTKQIGKLNIPSNLKINTSALLPGAKLIKPTETVAGTGVNKVPHNPESVDGPSTSSENEPRTNETLGIANHILPNSLKDRVRISVKRRPQSRRARQDALRTSGIDFSPTDDSSSISPSSSSFTTPPQNIVSPSTDEEDFHVPELDLSNEKEDHNIFNNLSKREVTAAIDESLLFNSAPVISPAEDKGEKKSTINTIGSSGSKSSGLFDASDDDDNLFSSVTAKNSNLLDSQKKSVLSDKKSKSTGSTTKTESLFSDIDDDDDIFSRQSTTTHAVKPITVSTLPNTSLDNNSQTFLDPLGLLKESKD